MQQNRSDSVRILAVDDEAYILDLFAEFLSSETSPFSFELTLCHEADEAVEAVRLSIKNKKLFAVAFIDIRLASGPDGVWAAERIRMLDPHVEIVMVTAYTDVSPKEIVTRMPPARKLLYIRKPFTAEEIKQFAVALSAKWQQEMQLQKIHTELESRVEKRTNALLKANERLKREIEERRRAAAELRQSENRYKGMFEHTSNGVVVYEAVAEGQDFTILEFNSAAERIEKIKRDAVVGKSVLEVFPGVKDLGLFAVFQNVWATGKAEQHPVNLYKDERIIGWRENFVYKLPSGEIVAVYNDVTERKQAEEEIRKSEERYRALVEDMPALICRFLPDGTLTFVNRAYCQFFNKRSEELLGHNFFHYIPEEDQERVRNKFSSLTQAKPMISYDHKAIAPDGDIRWQRWTDRALFDDKGNLIEYQSIGNDITESKNAEEALRESEERFREMADNVREVFWLYDWTKQEVVYVSPAYQEIWGRSIQGLYDRYEEWTDSIYPDDRDYARESFARIVHTGGGEPREYRIVRPDGVVRWVSDRGVAIRDKQGQVRRIAGIAEDITERKLAEEALRESEERYRTVLEANPDPVVVYDMDGRVLYFNPAFTRVFGWTLEERLGKKMDVFVPEKNWSETKVMISRVLAGESFSGFETCRYTKDEELIPVSISGAIYRDGAGNLLGSVINLRDVSEQKKLEAQLQQAQKMEAVGTLAGGIAHDFNNILQAIHGYTELLLARKKEGEGGWRELQEVLRAAKRGGELTQQLLTFSRKVESKRRPIDLNQEVEELRDLLERAIPKMIEVKFQLADDLQLVNADAVQLKQVLMNLVVNAKDAMPDGGTLLIETRNVTLDQDFCTKYPEVKPGDYVQFAISDTGHGMDRQTLQHIFDPFYTTKEIGKGTGLGLAIVYGIIKNHEGYTMCYSQPREGTTFKIYLPLLRKEIGLGNMAGAEGPGVSIKGGSETILLVDDEAFIRELGVDVLGQAGYHVLTAADGESALELYRQESDGIDLVILDLIMPGMGGSKCLEELLKVDPQAQILIASGYSPDDTTKRVLETGARGSIHKPYDTRQLLRLIREILDEN